MILKLSWPVRVMVIGCGLVLASLAFAGWSVSAARPQAAEVPSNPQARPEAPPVHDKADAQPAKRGNNKPDKDQSSDSDHSVKGFGRDFLEDQKRIWTSPARLGLADADWLVPASGFAAGLFVTDRDVSTHLSHNPSTISHYNTISTAGIGALVGGAAGLWVLSFQAHKEHWRETGFLAGEAAINSLVAVEALKYSLRRERPFQGDGSGPFFRGGTSFPSEHTAAAWSVAGVIAHEYPGLFPRIAVYGLASLVSYSRIKGRQHFPSDVFIGGMIGQFIAQDVYTRHHDPGLGGAEWRSIGNIVRGDGYHSPANQGSPYVPLDSWIYPALSRLAALGFIDSAFAGRRPWTRLECARLLNEAADHAGEDSSLSSETDRIIENLEREFAYESKSLEGGSNRQIRAESAYTRFTGISGQPLTDGYHIAQTLTDDYGRPYAEGFSNVTGFSGSANLGRLSVYVRGEYQHAPTGAVLPLAARQFIFATNNIPTLPPATPTPDVSRVQLLDTYASLAIENWQISFGKQSLWWGPSEGGPLMLNANASPINMFRISRVSPFKLPSFLGWLGPMKLELFLGQLSGHEFVFQTDTGIVGTFGHSLARQPFIQGEMFSFKPTPNFEFGFSVTTLFAGGPTPLTPYTWAKSFSIGNGNRHPGSKSDPGDRRSGLDFSYRVPGLRTWLTYYAEAFVEDEFSPIAYWNKAAIHSGIYMPRFPKIPKLDLRVEGGYTDLPSDVYHPSNNVFYTNSRYGNGYTNQGNLLGSWMGRQSQGAQAWSTYRFTPRNSLQFGYRHQKISQAIMPGGGTLTDGSLQADFLVRTDLSLAGSVQYETWDIPVLAPAAKSDVTASLQITLWPHSPK